MNLGKKDLKKRLKGFRKYRKVTWAGKEKCEKEKKKSCNVSLLIYRAVAYTQKINPIIAKK